MPKPFTAVSVAIETQTGEGFAVDDLSCIPDIVELVSIQQTGPEEAARAIRKKLKYGNVHRQLRALVILDGLIQNAGPRFQRSFANEALLERLRVCGTSSLSDAEVRKKCDELFRSWGQYKNVTGMHGIATLVNQLPRRKVAVTRDASKAVRESENPFDDDEDNETETSQAGPSSASSQPSASGASEWPSSSSAQIPYGHPTGTVQSFSHTRSSSGFWSSSSRKKDKEKEKEKERERERERDRTKKKGQKRAPFNLNLERPKIKSTIADSSLAATNLLNAMQVVNRETQQISENQACVDRFDECKRLRRQVLRYIHNVPGEEFLGGLLHANDELITALITFEQLDRSIDADSDSDDDLAQQAHMYRMAQLRSHETGGSTSPRATSPPPPPDMSSLSLNSPKAPASPPVVTSPPRAPPPRPSAASKPPPLMPPRLAQTHSAAQDEDEDEDDPFADSNIME